MSTPLFSVVIPYHDSVPRDLLARAENSVNTQRGGFSVQLITVHDRESKGPAWARNHGVELSTAPWIVLLDADDYLEEEFLGYAWVELGEGPVVVSPSSSPLNESILKDNYLPYCAVIHRDIWKSLGGYEEPSDKGNGLCDWDWWIKCWLNKVSMKYMNPELFHHTDRPGSMSKWDMAHFEAMRQDLYKKYENSIPKQTA